MRETQETMHQIYAVSGDRIYESDLVEAVNEALNDSVELREKFEYYFIQRKVTSLTEEDLIEGTKAKYLVVNEGNLDVYTSLILFEQSFTDMISIGCEFYKIEELSEMHIEKVLTEERAVSLTESISKLPDEDFVAISVDMNKCEPFKSLSFNKSNFLSMMQLMDFDNCHYAFYQKDISKLSSTMSVERFLRYADEILYATLMHKENHDKCIFYNHRRAQEFNGVSLTGDVNTSEFLVKDIVPLNSDTVELPFTLNEYKEIRCELEKAVVKLNKDIDGLVCKKEIPAGNCKTISTEPLD